VHRAERAKRVALVDDIDRTPGGAKAIADLVRYLEAHFSAVILSANAGFELAELVDKRASEALKNYQYYAITNFGYKLRRQLLKKWCLCGGTSTIQEFDKKVHAVEEFLNSVVGRNLVPPRPLFLLVLLQSHEATEQTEIQDSGFAHYYHYLITKSFQDLGVKREHHNELFNYLSQLAWLYRKSDIRELSYEQLRSFNKTFSQKFVSVDLDSRLNLLIRSRLLTKRGDLYSFTYPYIFFFFVGKFLADNIHKQDIKETVTQWCANLQKRENAHSILFLTHHRNDPWLVEQILHVLKSCFADLAPMQLDSDVEGMNKLIDSATQLIVDDSDIERNQHDARALKDKVEQEEEQAEQKAEAIKEAFGFMEKAYLLLRTAEILGQILKNYYGSLERPVKAQLMSQVFDAPLRLLRAVLNEIASDPESFVDDVEAVVEQRRGRLKPEKKKELARRISFHILGFISTGAVIRAAQFVNAEKLREDIHDVVTSNSTNAYRLIGAATRLMTAGELPVDEIRVLAEDLKTNIFAYSILQSLGAFHIHLFYTGDAEKQQLCEHLNISMAKSRALDLKTSKTKLLQDNKRSRHHRKGK
jgi:hypothetical protein